MSYAIYLIFSDQLCLSLLSDNCQKWDSSKLTLGKLNAFEFTLKGESSRGLLLCCAVSRSSISRFPGLDAVIPHYHHVSSHIYFYILLCWWRGKETRRVSATYHRDPVTHRLQGILLPTRDPAQWDFSLWVCLNSPLNWMPFNPSNSGIQRIGK